MTIIELRPETKPVQVTEIQVRKPLELVRFQEQKPERTVDEQIQLHRAMVSRALGHMADGNLPDVAHEAAKHEATYHDGQANKLILDRMKATETTSRND